MNIYYDNIKERIYLTRNTPLYNQGTSISRDELSSESLSKLIEILEEWKQKGN